jgi:AAA+ ATPase superfamily predicted ATPase
MFHASTPVTAQAFINRRVELARLHTHVDKLLHGAPSWLAIIGPRKIGKTSLILEAARQLEGRKLVFVTLDSFEVMPLSPEIFRRYALRLMDGLFSVEVGASLEVLASRPEEYRAALQRSRSFSALPPELRAFAVEVPEQKMTGTFARECLDATERFAAALGLHLVVGWDEFQELLSLSQSSTGDPIPLARSVWQKHRRVAYFISGSARSMLMDLVSSSHSPFYQHFEVLELGAFEEGAAIELLVSNIGRGHRLDPALAAKVVAAVGSYPFYLQLVGEALAAKAAPLDDGAVKEALQEVLFSRTGRLGLFFETRFRELVGRASFLAATLSALAGGPKRLNELARELKTSSAAVSTYLDRLREVVTREEGGVYRLDDPTFGRWLAWRRPDGAAVPMKLLGDEAEGAVAQLLMNLGFDLVYQSRASRGEFDLLGTHGSRQLGVQVKRAALPVSFTRTEWARMEAESIRFGWSWIVAAVNPGDQEVTLLDPSLANRGKTFRLAAPAAIDNLLLWLAKAKAKARAKPKPPPPPRVTARKRSR